MTNICAHSVTPDNVEIYTGWLHRWKSCDYCLNHTKSLHVFRADFHVYNMFADIDVSMRHSEFKKSFFYSSAADYILNNLSYGRILSEDESLLKCTEKNLLPLIVRKGACHREFCRGRNDRRFGGENQNIS